MRYECPICGGKDTGIAHYTYPSRRSVNYMGIQVVCNSCGYTGDARKNLEDAVKSFKETA